MSRKKSKAGLRMANQTELKRCKVGIKNAVFFVVGISGLFLLVTILLHGEVRVQRDFKQPGFDGQSLLLASREQTRLREQQESGAPNHPKSESSYETSQHLDVVEDLPKTLFEEGKGVSAFQFKTEILEESDIVNNDNKNLGKTVKRDLTRARNFKSVEKTSKFGLPSQPPALARA